MSVPENKRDRTFVLGLKAKTPILQEACMHSDSANNILCADVLYHTAGKTSQNSTFFLGTLQIIVNQPAFPQSTIQLCFSALAPIENKK